MTTTQTRSISVAALVASALVLTSGVFAQTPGRSDAKETRKTDSAGKSGEVSSKDKALDSLLEKLGASEDKPSPDDRPRGAGNTPPKDEAPSEKGEKSAKPDEKALTGKAQKLDEHLEEITGKRRKRDRRDQDDEASPLSDVIKQMREVEERLGKPDTGEETRKKQTQIVKRLETLIEEMKSSQSQSRSMRQRKLAMKPGQQPGQQNSNDPGATGGNAPIAKPIKPNEKRSLLGGKDAWGHLPPELRQELENVFKEEPLPDQEDLIRRYYLSVSKKSLSRGEARP